MSAEGATELVIPSDFPAALPAEDAERWTAMTPNQRARARARLDAILAWRSGDLPLADALKQADLSRTRFYTVAGDFKTSGNLASLGAFAGIGGMKKRLDPEVVNALQAVVADVVATNSGTSVNQLVQLMVEAAGVGGKSVPSGTKLRQIVETEIRRSEATGQAGHAVKFDMSAINLPREDGRPYILFVMLDEGTRLVFGAWSGESTDEAAGYKHAARDAKARLADGLSAIRWADRLMRIDMAVGPDRRKGGELRSRLIEKDIGANVTLSPERYGRYIRKLVGPRFGRIAITPGRTESGLASPDNEDMTPWSDRDAQAAVALAVNRHNAEILAALDDSSGRPAMPDGLARALDILAD